jgi:ComEC/Rec2-related protein
MKRKAIWFAVFWLAGVAISVAFSNLVLIYIGLYFVCAAGLYAIFRAKNVRLKTACFAVCALGIGLVYAQTFYELRFNNVMQYENLTLDVTGIITEKTEHNENSTVIVDGKINNKTRAKISAYVRDDTTYFNVGDSVTLHGKLIKPQNSFAFSSENYYKTKQIFLQMPFAESITVNAKNDNPILIFTENYREKLYNIIHEAIPDRDNYSLMLAMLFGDRERITDSQTSAINAAGISHIMAVSGAQLAVICSAVILVSGLFGVRKKVAFFIMLIPLAVFILLAEDAVSIRRAAIMVIITYSNVFFSRRPDTANSLAIACIFLIAANPFAITDASFLLSAGGVFSLAVVYPTVMPKERKTADEIRKAAKLEIKPKFNPFLWFFTAVRDIFVASAVISLTLIPICFFFFDSVSLVAPLTNILMIPISSLVVILGMVVVLTGGVSFIAFPILFLCNSLCSLTWAITYFFAKFPVMPMGYAFEKPLLIILGSLLSIVFIFIKTFKKRALAYLCSVLVFISSVCIYRLIPARGMTVAIVGEKDFSAVIIHDKFSAAIIDLSGGGDAANSVSNYLSRFDITNITTLILTDKFHLSYPVYKNEFETKTVSNILCPMDDYKIDNTLIYENNTHFPIIKDAYITVSDNDYFIDSDGVRINLLAGDFDLIPTNSPMISVYYVDNHANNITNSDLLVLTDSTGIVYADNKTDVIISDNVSINLSNGAFDFQTLE